MGPFADDTWADLVTHAADELAHHGAEIGLLRDLHPQLSDRGWVVPARPRHPDDHEPIVDVGPAVGRFPVFATVVGTRRPGAPGCWCMAYRDSYPAQPSDGRVDVVSGYVGTVELFERAGFERVAPTTSHGGGAPRRVMRRTLP